MTATIERNELERLIATGSVTVVDALAAPYHELQHLPGAINLAPADVVRLAPRLLPDRDVHGDLTIHGVTRRTHLDVTFDGYVRDPWGGDRSVFSARAKVNREDFGITWNVALEAGGLLVSRDVTIEIALETVHAAG